MSLGVCLGGDMGSPFAEPLPWALDRVGLAPLPFPLAADLPEGRCSPHLWQDRLRAKLSAH